MQQNLQAQVLAEIDRVVLWAALVQLIALYYLEGKCGRPPVALETMLRVHFMQQWFSVSDPAMEEASFDLLLWREFVQLEELARFPDESTILRFRHRELHDLGWKSGAVVAIALDANGLVQWA